MKRVVAVIVVAGLCVPLSVALADGPSGTVSREEFVAKAATSGSTELQLGKMALQRAERAEVRAYAEQVVMDHAAANMELLAMAARKQIAVPKSVEPKQQDAIAKLSKLRGTDFDRAFASQMIADHKSAVALYRSQSEHGQDPELKAYATKVLPTLEEHLRLARSLAGEKTSETQKTAGRGQE